MKKRRAKNLLAELADQALMARYLIPVSEHHDLPGQTIGRLTEEQRRLLQELKSDDIANARWPRPDGVNLEKMPRKVR